MYRNIEQTLDQSLTKGNCQHGWIVNQVKQGISCKSIGNATSEQIKICDRFEHPLMVENKNTPNIRSLFPLYGLSRWGEVNGQKTNKRKKPLNIKGFILYLADTQTF